MVAGPGHHRWRWVHEQVSRLVGSFVSRGIGGRRLSRLCQSLEVELVRVPLAMDFGHDVLIIVVAQSSAQLVVVHVRFALSLTPATSHFVRVRQFKFAVRALPRDAVGVGRVRQ